MGIAKLYGQKASGMNINGIIKDYHVYAGENVSAGDLVEYINGIASQRIETSSDVRLLETTQTADFISALALDDKRVFIAHSYGSDWHLYGVVVTIDGTSITCGTDTVISATAYAGKVKSLELLPNGNVFIAYSRSSSHYLNAIVCIVSGTTITAGTDTNISTSGNTGYAISTVTMSNNTIFMAYSYGSSYYLYGAIVKIDGTTVKTEGTTKLIDTSNAGYSVSVEKVGEGEVFIVHSSGSSYTLNTCYCSISGTTVTRGTKYSLSSNEKSGYGIKTKLLEERKIFIAHCSGGANYLYGMILTCTGSTISNGVDVLIADVNTSQSQELAVINSGKALITYKYGTSYQLYSTICTVDGETITPHTNTQLHTNSYTHESSIAVLQNGGIFIAHSDTSDYYLNGQVWGVDETNNTLTNDVPLSEYETQVRKTTTSQFDGVAKTSGIGGTTTVPKDYVSVYTLDTNFVTADGNAIMTADKNTFITKQ